MDLTNLVQRQRRKSQIWHTASAITSGLPLDPTALPSSAQCFLLPFSAFRVPLLESHYGTPQIAQKPVNFGFIFSTKKSQECVSFISTLRIF